MNRRSVRGSNSAGAEVGEGARVEGGKNARAEEYATQGSNEVPLLAPLAPPSPPLPPPPPMTHAEMMAEMLAARQETTRALEMMLQALGGFARGGHGGNGGNGGGARGLERPCSYHDFLKTNPPTFTPTREPLDAEHWLRVMEQKFLLLDITEELKVRFAAQQLLGSASAWWDTFNAMQPVDHRVTWPEFTTAFWEYYIPAGLLNRKVTEFLELTKGNMSMLDYANKFNQLAQYAWTHVDTDTKKRDRFYRGLSCMLQEKLFTR
jgi:hypothetical protein